MYKAVLKGSYSYEDHEIYCNKLTSTIRAAKSAYFANFINNHKPNARAMWQ